MEDKMNQGVLMGLQDGLMKTAYYVPSTMSMVIPGVVGGLGGLAHGLYTGEDTLRKTIGGAALGVALGGMGSQALQTPWGKSVADRFAAWRLKGLNPSSADMQRYAQNAEQWAQEQVKKTHQG